MPQASWITGRLSGESAASRFLYNTVLKRSSTYMTGVMVVATTVGAPRAPPPPPPLPLSRLLQLARAPAFPHVCTSRYCSAARSIAHAVPGAFPLQPWLTTSLPPFAVSPPRSCSGIGYDMFMNSLWRSWNKGKLWKDIKNNYKEE